LMLSLERFHFEGLGLRFCFSFLSPFTFNMAAELGR
jgi:hypothetical protein